MPLVWRVLLAVLLVGVAGAAQAHTRSESHTSWSVDGRVVRVSVTAPDLEAARIADSRRPSDKQLLAYLLPRVGADAGGERCAALVPPRIVAATSGFRRVEFLLECRGTAPITARFSAFFELVPTHIDLAQIEFANGNFVEQVFSSDVQTLDLHKAQGGELEGAGFARFVEMGVMHIFTGVDHMSFLLGLVLISRRLRDLVFVVTGFTIGHSLTLGLAVTGLIRPHAEFVDALVALTIALIGVENIVVRLRQPLPTILVSAGALALMAILRLLGIGLLPPFLLVGAAIFTGCYLNISGHLHDTARLRIVVTTVFGLIHGFGFAADLLESRLPPAKLAQILVGFNVGVELAQLTVVLLLAAVVVAARRMRVATPRPITIDILASFLVAIGTFWFVGRSF